MSTVASLTAPNGFGRSGLYCRFDCEVEPGRPWRAVPKTESSIVHLNEAIAERNAHELAVHGEVFKTRPFELTKPPRTFTSRKK